MEEGIRADDEPTCPHTEQVFENRIEVIFAAGIEDMELQPEFAGSRQHRTPLRLGQSGIGRVDEQSHDAGGGDQLMQQLQQLWRYLHVQLGYACDIPPGRFKLPTRPSRIGSEAVSKTIGVTAVAALAAMAAAVLVAAITATCRLTRSAAMPGSRSNGLLAQRYSMTPRTARVAARQDSWQCKCPISQRSIERW